MLALAKRPLCVACRSTVFWRSSPRRSASSLRQAWSTISTRESSSAFKGLCVSAGALLAAQSCATSLCEVASRGDDVPPFDPEKSYYDTTTYVGRVKNALSMIDSRMLLVSDTELQRCQSLLSEFKSGRRSKDTTDADLWHAKRVVDSMIHPVTGEKMFILGRMSAFVPVNIPVAAGMLIHGPTSTIAAVFWQWINQSTNVVCNYVNRSGATVDWNGIMQSYALATSVSCGFALAAGRLMTTNPALKRFGILVPYCAVISASTANMFFSRMEEWTRGVPVFDEEGKERGISARAGLEGVVRTVTTRSWIIPMPLLILPPIMMKALQKMPVVASKRWLLTLLELSAITASLQVALPLVLAMQPATMKLQAQSLEADFHGLKDSKGNEVLVLYANKGL